jgi:hypothetical protein
MGINKNQMVGNNQEHAIKQTKRKRMNQRRREFLSFFPHSLGLKLPFLTKESFPLQQGVSTLNGP